jgi:hypothetical protein
MRNNLVFEPRESYSAMVARSRHKNLRRFLATLNVIPKKVQESGKNLSYPQSYKIFLTTESTEHTEKKIKFLCDKYPP